MDLENELKLSYYKEIADIDAPHGVKLVQQVESGKLFVKKTLDVYDRRVFGYLQAHPVKGTPSIAELVEEGGRLYVIEAYIAGDCLRTRLDQNGPLPEREAVRYVDQLCGILHSLHSFSPPIVHRDIKPENLIVTPEGTLYLIDFNSAKFSVEGGNRDTVLIGTVGYAAPEQYGFQASSPATDIYAMGVLLNEFLTAKLPGEKRYGGSLGAIVDKCLQMDPGKRYLSVDKLQSALRRERISEKKVAQGFRGYLPPGFRGKNPLVIFFAVIWYAFYLAMGVTLETTGSLYELVLDRIAFTTYFTLATLFVGNYRNIWMCFPLVRNRNVAARILGLVLWTALLLITVVIVELILIPS